MKKLTFLMLLIFVAAGCAPAGRPSAPPKAIKVVVIGKSVNPYWSNVEKGV